QFLLSAWHWLPPLVCSTPKILSLEVVPLKGGRSTSDLPFTLNRFVQHEVIEHMIPASDDRAGTFGKQFGILLAEHAVLTRAVFVVDQNGIVQHSQVVTEFTDEPDYQAAMDVVEALA
ncbi:MAG: redoxin family protein, partial [Planctomycetota bacterium]